VAAHSLPVSASSKEEQSDENNDARHVSLLAGMVGMGSATVGALGGSLRPDAGTGVAVMMLGASAARGAVRSKFVPSKPVRWSASIVSTSVSGTAVCDRAELIADAVVGI